MRRIRTRVGLLALAFSLGYLATVTTLYLRGEPPFKAFCDAHGVECEEGRRVARSEFDTGAGRLYVIGKPNGWQVDLMKRMDQEGLPYELDLACLSTDERLAWMLGYNEIASDRMRPKLGFAYNDRIESDWRWSRVAEAHRSLAALILGGEAS